MGREIDAGLFVIAETIIERRSGAFEPAGPSTALAFNMHASVVMLARKLGNLDQGLRRPSMGCAPKN